MYIDPTEMFEFAFHVTILPADGLEANATEHLQVK